MTPSQHTKRIAVVMAAGKGTRMKSELPKVLYPILNRPMIEYVLDALEQSGIDRTIAVVGYQGALVRETLAHRQHLEFAEQKEQLGTGHAVMMCREHLAKHQGAVFVIAGDSPMIQTDSIQKLFEAYDNAPAELRPACILGTAHKEDPRGLGRILRNTQGDFTGIVEEKDASSEQRLITEVNMSYYVFYTPALLSALSLLQTNNAQKEYYITDVPGILLSQGHRVLALPVLKPAESLGINTVEEAQIVESAMQ